jgi:hypothetical protein
MAIATVAGAQGGHITHEQLLAIGLTANQITYRIRVGRLIHVYGRGVYAVGHLPTSPIDRARGALLACGERAVLSHASAAFLWGITTAWPEPIELSSAIDVRPPGLIVHRAKLARRDVRTIHRVRVTSPARTVLDMAPRLTPKRLTRVLNELRLNHGLKLETVAEILERFPRHPGARHLRPLVAAGQSEPTRSAFEDEWPAFAADHDLPPYDMNVIVCGYRVDVRFRNPPLIVELDGWAFHRTKRAFSDDRERDATILAQTGMPTVRLTYDAFHAGPAAQAERLKRILAALARGIAKPTKRLAE